MNTESSPAGGSEQKELTPALIIGHLVLVCASFMANVHLFFFFFKAVIGCVSIAPGIVQNLNIMVKKIIIETSKFRKTSQISIKRFSTLMR